MRVTPQRIHTQNVSQFAFDYYNIPKYGFVARSWLSYFTTDKVNLS